MTTSIALRTSGHVHRMGDRFEMGGVDADLDLAEMVDFQSGRHWTDQKPVREDVRAHTLEGAVFASVAAAGGVSGPEPARFGLVDETPETLFPGQTLLTWGYGQRISVVSPPVPVSVAPAARSHRSVAPVNNAQFCHESHATREAGGGAHVSAV